MISREEIENQAALDRRTAGEVEPPYAPSHVLVEGFGVRVKWGVLSRIEAVLIPSGLDPHVTVSKHVGSAEGRRLTAHELGHLALGHVEIGLFSQPAHAKGGTLTKAQESDADYYSRCFMLPSDELCQLIEADTQSVRHLMCRFDVTARVAKQRVTELGLRGRVYDDQNPEMYRRWGWWQDTRRPQYLATVLARQGRLPGQQPRCETPGCRRLAVIVHHLQYNDGHEADDDLEALCNDCHYDRHISNGRIR